MDRLKYFQYLVHDISELHHTDSDQSVVPAEAVVLHSDVKLVGGHLLLVADNAGQEEGFSEQTKLGDCADLQMKSFVKLW